MNRPDQRSKAPLPPEDEIVRAVPGIAVRLCTDPPISEESQKALADILAAATRRLNSGNDLIGPQPNVPTGSTARCQCCKRKTERWDVSCGVLVCRLCWPAWQYVSATRDVHCSHNGAT